MNESQYNFLNADEKIKALQWSVHLIDRLLDIAEEHDPKFSSSNNIMLANDFLKLMNNEMEDSEKKNYLK